MFNLDQRIWSKLRFGPKLDEHKKKDFHGEFEQFIIKFWVEAIASQ